MKSYFASVLEAVAGISRIKYTFDKKNIKPDRRMIFSRPSRSFYRRYSIDHQSIAGCDCYTLRSQKTSKHHIFFFHGGGYIFRASILHWYTIGFFLKNLPCAVTFVDYPLAPESSCTDTLAAVLDIYRSLSGDIPITLMGDSAGGGLCLALAQQIQAQHITPAPCRLVLFSAWLDISMRERVSPELDKKDKMLSIDGLRRAGLVYAKDKDVTDPLCSPVFGPLDGIGEVAIFIGSSDILVSDNRRLHARLIQEKIAHAYFEYPDMQHTFMLLPIPEGIDALKKACVFIKDPCSLSV